MLNLTHAAARTSYHSVCRSVGYESQCIAPAATTEQTYERLIASAEEQVRHRKSIILDASFARRQHRDLLANRFRELGVAYCFVEAQANDAVLKRRLRARETKPDEVSDARLEDFEMLTGLYEPPIELTPVRYLQIQTSTPLDESVTKALKSLSQIQGESSCQ